MLDAPKPEFGSEQDFTTELFSERAPIARGTCPIVAGEELGIGLKPARVDQIVLALHVEDHAAAGCDDVELLAIDALDAG